MKPDNFHRERRTGSVLAGVFLLTIGVFAIVQQTVSDFPSWIMSWPMLLIAIGIFIGLKHGFRGPGWIILIGMGSIFLVDRIVPGANLKPYIWPFLIICAGFFMILGGGRRKRWARDHWRQWNNCTDKINGGMNSPAGQSPVNSEGEANEDQFIDSTSVLGSTKKVIFSKNFKGGDIINFMGGAEINCSQADIRGVVRLDITQIFGGTKLIIPPHWTVKSTATSIFAGFEDKRNPANTIPSDPGKVLIIDGTSIFGGVEIKSF